MASSSNVRRFVLTASIAAITATGAWYGAGLKTRQEFKQERQAASQATPAERTEQLEAMKSKLQRHKAELQSKIERLSTESTSTSHDSAGQAG